MAKLIPMPQLGSTMSEGLIVRWLKQEGEPVKQGEPLLEVETDIATLTVEAEGSGVLRRILAPVDATVPIHRPIAILAAAHEPIGHLTAEAGKAVVAATPASNNALPTPSANPATEPIPNNISPRARRLAEENNIPLGRLIGRGTGPDGRILERDVAAYIEASADAVPEDGTQETETTGVDMDALASGLPGSRVRPEEITPSAETKPRTRSPRLPATPESATAPGDTFTVVGFHGMRRRIADTVSRSAFTAPHVTLALEVDMTAAAELRARLKPDIEQAYGARLSFTDLLVKAVARALHDFPLLNATLVDEEIRLHRHKNIGVTVALEEGMVVPVVRHAEAKTLGAISAELRPLIARALAGKITPEETQDGTFTITNLGAFGIDLFDPIITTGQAAILGVGRIADKPVVVDGEVVVRSMMNLCLSFDHRLVDGVPAARFLKCLKELLETPLLILV